MPARSGPGLGSLPCIPFVAGCSGLFIPNPRADRAGGGSRGGSFLEGGPPAESCLLGVRGGNEGVLGGATNSLVVTLGVDLVVFSGTRAWFVSCVGVRLGGSGGRLAGSKTGAIFLPASTEGVLGSEVLEVPFEIADREDMLEAIDSLESRLDSCSDGRRGGKVGQAWTEGCLGGNRGGGVGLEAGFADC